MYQSPIAAIAELIANSWDADAENVWITLPERIDDAEIVIRDDGVGMTFDECQAHYLNVGWCRRGTVPDSRSPGKDRPVLGRKGIGKFAGFGIAERIAVDTVSATTGEKTVFELDIGQLRGEEYATTEGGEIDVLDFSGPDDSRRAAHGTTITLKGLKLLRRPSPDRFRNGERAPERKRKKPLKA